MMSGGQGTGKHPRSTYFLDLDGHLGVAWSGAERSGRRTKIAVIPPEFMIGEG
jgi:hypothetical protein